MSFRLGLVLALCVSANGVVGARISAQENSAGTSSGGHGTLTTLRLGILRTAGSSARVTVYDRALRVALERVPGVVVHSAIELNVDDLQLALGCVGESDACLEQVREHVGAQSLVLPRLDQVGDTVVATVLVYHGGDHTRARVQRTYRGERAVEEAVDDVDHVARELFHLPEPAAPSAEPAAVSAWPLVTLGVGALVVGTGALLLGLAHADGQAYLRAQPTTPAEVDQAYSQRQRADLEQTLSLVFFGVGAAVVVAGAIWFFGFGREDGSSIFAAPVATASMQGLMVGGWF